MKDQAIFAYPEPIEASEFAFESPDIPMPEGILERREFVQTVKYLLPNGLFRLFVRLLGAP